VTEDVGDCVRLAGPRRPLHRAPGAVLRLGQDALLLLIRGQREQQRLGISAGASGGDRMLAKRLCGQG
jgi:hypothetical protein